MTKTTDGLITGLSCPNCSQKVSINPKLMGRVSLRCPTCRTDFSPGELLLHNLADNEVSTMPRVNSATSTGVSKPQATDNVQLDLKAELQKRIVGQDHVLDDIASTFYRWEVGLSSPQAPAGVFLLLGPTGTGKTRTVEALSETLFGSDKAFLKIDCAEFAHSHEIAKLLGSPPGYLGHRETHPVLTQENLNRYHNDRFKCSVLLLDEIEKSSDALWNLLLGILDKAVLTLGDNRKVDFSNTFVFMTSNLGAREMTDVLTGYGYKSDNKVEISQRKLDEIALNAAKRKFAPELMNRIDGKLVYRTLDKDNLTLILDQAIEGLQNRLLSAKGPNAFVLKVTPDAKEFLLAAGTSSAYGARELKRSVEQHLSKALVHQIRAGVLDGADVVTVSLKDDKCHFKKTVL